MKFLTRIHNPKVHPVSIRIVDITSRILFTHGIGSEIDRAKCSLEFFKLTILNAKEIQQSIAKDTNTDKILVEQSEKFKGILAKYGIENKEEQEQIILEYLEGVGTLGE